MTILRMCVWTGVCVIVSIFLCVGVGVCVAHLLLFVTRARVLEWCYRRPCNSLTFARLLSLVDEIVRVSEDEAAEAFLRTLTYTKTLTNGKGALGLAGT